VNQYLILIDYVGVGLFAATGALAASRQQLDFIGFVFFAILTGIGGGSVRDVVLSEPIFWVGEPLYLVVCTITALIVYCTAHFLESRYIVLQWLDAGAVALFAVFGAYKGLLITDSPSVATLTGAMTATLGGIMRDVLAGEQNAITRQEIYVTAAVAGAAVYIALWLVGIEDVVPALIGGLVAFALRAGALAFGWSLPRYRPRPGRPFDPS
tara:strand:+ start:2350 stop:2982 length:633 start_codon:yes stop_codon:yes gene_type:complete